MKRFISYTFVLILLASCGGKQGPVKNPQTDNKPLTPNEDRGIKEITGFYGGDCTYSQGKTPSKTGAIRYFKLQVTNSSALDKVENIAPLSTANIAITFYNSLERERMNFDEIQSVILFSDGKKVENHFSAKSLDQVLMKMSTVLKVIGYLKEKNYDSLSSVIDDKNGLTVFNKKALIKEIKSADDTLGNIKEFVPYGFAFFKTKDQKRNILHISGVIVRDKLNNEFSVDIDADSDKEQVLMISYKI